MDPIETQVRVTLDREGVALGAVDYAVEVWKGKKDIQNPISFCRKVASEYVEPPSRPPLGCAGDDLCAGGWRETLLYASPVIVRNCPECNPR